MNSLNDMLTQMVKKNASDLHLTVGSSVRMRINGKLIIGISISIVISLLLII